jgi:hypothetical protein
LRAKKNAVRSRSHVLPACPTPVADPQRP